MSATCPGENEAGMFAWNGLSGKPRARARTISDAVRPCRAVAFSIPVHSASEKRMECARRFSPGFRPGDQVLAGSGRWVRFNRVSPCPRLRAVSCRGSQPGQLHRLQINYRTLMWFRKLQQYRKH